MIPKNKPAEFPNSQAAKSIPSTAAAFSTTEAMDFAGAQAAIQYSYDAVVLTDLDGTIQDWNRGAQMLFGVSRKDAIGRTENDIFRSTTLKALSEQISRDISLLGSWEGELDVIRGGSAGTCELTVLPQLDADRNLIGYIRILRDLTELRKAEQLLAECRANLISEWKQTIQLEIARDLARELSAPLGELRFQVATMGTTPSSSTKPEDLDKLSSEIAALDRVALRLGLCLESGESGKVQTRTFVTLVEDAIEIFRERIERDKINCSRLDTASLATVDCVPNQIKQGLLILLRICQEAAKDTSERSIKIVTELDGDWAVLRVTHSGPVTETPAVTAVGISQGQRSQSEVLKDIVESHRGWFFVESSQESSTYTIRLPKTLSVTHKMKL